MANKSPTPDERVIYLTFKNIFKGQDAGIRNAKPIKKLIQKHQDQELIADLVREHSFDVLCNSVQLLLSPEIFSSTLKAKLRFPELFDPSPTQSAEKEASEAEAARHEADAIEQLVQRGGGIVEFQKEPDAGPAAATQEAGFPAPSSHTVVPSLFPVYLPSSMQHKLLAQLQSLLELACYDFGVRKLPNVLRDRQWDCAESVELNRWTDEFARRSSVHRVRVSAKAVEQFLLDAETLVTLLGDTFHVTKISKLRRDIQTIIEELEQNKHFLRSRLARTLQQIENRRAELKVMEDRAIADMTKEDDEYQTLAGKSLAEIIEPSEASFSTAIDTEKGNRADDIDGQSARDMEDTNDEVRGDDEWNSNFCGSDQERTLLA